VCKVKVKEKIKNHPGPKSGCPVFYQMSMASFFFGLNIPAINLQGVASAMICSLKKFKNNHNQLGMQSQRNKFKIVFNSPFL